MTSDDHPKGGRPSKFSDRLVETILALAAEGKTDAQIAKRLGIARSTLALWKGGHAEFSDAVSKAKNVADDLVEAALFQRAVGYRHPAVKFFCHEGRITSERYTEIYPPDTGAATLWLKNRRPDEWREKTEIEHSGSVEGPQIVITIPSNGREAKEAQPEAATPPIESKD